MADEVNIVVINGIRYREEDAKRRGLLDNKTSDTDSKSTETQVKARRAANKAVEPENK